MDLLIPIAAGPACVDRAPSVLSFGNSVSVTWTKQPGATSYDVLRRASDASPSSGACTCAVATGLTSAAYSDQGGAPSTYTLALAPAARGSIYLNNRDQSNPQYVFDPPYGSGGGTISSARDVVAAFGTIGTGTKVLADNGQLIPTYQLGLLPGLVWNLGGTSRVQKTPATAAQLKSVLCTDANFTALNTAFGTSPMLSTAASPSSISVVQGISRTYTEKFTASGLTAAITPIVTGLPTGCAPHRSHPSQS